MKKTHLRDCMGHLLYSEINKSERDVHDVDDDGNDDSDDSDDVVEKKKKVSEIEIERRKENQTEKFCNSCDG